jgi:hypothetical protein
MEERRGVYRVLVGKHEGMRPLGRPRLRLEDNIKWIFKKWDVDVWTGSRYRQVAGTCECGNEPSGFIKCGEFLD